MSAAKLPEKRTIENPLISTSRPAKGHRYLLMVSNLGGLPALLQDGAAGFGFDPTNVQDFEAKLRWAIGHPDTLAAMSTAAQTTFRASHTVERNYLNLMAIYEPTISASKAKRLSRSTPVGTGK